MTTKEKATAEKLLEEEREMDAEIERLEAERGDLESPAPVLTWEQLRAGAVDDLEKRERRRGIVPRLITAAKIKRLEIRRERYEAELAPLIERRDKAYAKREAATEKRLKAIEEEGVARGELSDAQMRVRQRERFVKEIDRDLRALKGEGGGR